MRMQALVRYFQFMVVSLQPLAALVLLWAPLPAAAELTGSVLWFMEQEAGGEPYRVRYLITEGYLRSDEGSDDGDFLLFDREQQQVYNVIPDNQSIVQIDGKGARPAVPETLSLQVTAAADEKAPKLDGKTPVLVELRADKQLCYSAVVVPAFYEPARLAFVELAQALALQQTRTIDSTPSEFQTPCFLANFLYASDFHLQRGLPLLEWSPAGERRELVHYEAGVSLSDSLFRLPSGFSTFQTPGR